MEDEGVEEQARKMIAAIESRDGDGATQGAQLMNRTRSTDACMQLKEERDGYADGCTQALRVARQVP